MPITALSRPGSVTTAAILLLNGFAIAAIFMAARLGHELPGMRVFLYGFMTFTFLLLGFLVLKTAQGLNWARITCLCLVAVRSAGAISHIFSDSDAVPFGGLIRLLPMVFEISAIILLFSPSANSWFKGRAGQL
jgi:hypothetical protein